MTEPRTIHEVPTIFRGARGFGLSDEEIWEMVNEVCDRLPPGKAAQALEAVGLSE